MDGKLNALEFLTMNVDTGLRACPPTALNKARAIAHKAAQLVTAAARANLEPRADDSHSNLGWDNGGRRFVSHPLSGQNGNVFVGFSLSPLQLDVIESSKLAAMLELNESSVSDACEWLDRRLSEYGLQPATKARLPYELPPEVASIDVFRTVEETDGLACLAEWFDLANTHLVQFVGDHSDLSPGPSPVRCWPHHFDIGTYVQLQVGDSETAKGIGVGMSPGDESYGQPYFYINPWPHMDPAGLPEPPAPGHWHTEGFVGAIATGDEVLILGDISRDLSTFIERAFVIGREQLDA